jgi:hypothetical protein
VSSFRHDTSVSEYSKFYRASPLLVTCSDCSVHVEFAGCIAVSGIVPSWQAARLNRAIRYFYLLQNGDTTRFILSFTDLFELKSAWSLALNDVCSSVAGYGRRLLAVAV